MNKVSFYSVLLDGTIKFKTGKEEYAIFYIASGKDKYRMICFNDAPCYGRLKTCAEKGYLAKNKPVWIEAEMTMYEDKVIADSLWNTLVNHSEETIIKTFGSTTNPTGIWMPQFKVTNWDFAIPKGANEKKEEPLKFEIVDELEPLSLNNWEESV